MHINQYSTMQICIHQSMSASRPNGQTHDPYQRNCLQQARKKSRLAEKMSQRQSTTALQVESPTWMPYRPGGVK